MTISLYNDHFTSEDEAKREIEAHGLWMFKKETPSTHNKPHWHAYDAHLYILSGTLNLTEFETGETFVCPVGAKLEVPARTLHHEQHEGYTALFGITADPQTLEQPIQRPSEEL